MPDGRFARPKPKRERSSSRLAILASTKVMRLVARPFPALPPRGERRAPKGLLQEKCWERHPAGESRRSNPKDQGAPPLPFLAERKGPWQKETGRKVDALITSTWRWNLDCEHESPEKSLSAPDQGVQICPGPVPNALINVAVLCAHVAQGHPALFRTVRDAPGSCFDSCF